MVKFSVYLNRHVFVMDIELLRNLARRLIDVTVFGCQCFGVLTFRFSLHFSCRIYPQGTLQFIISLVGRVSRTCTNLSKVFPCFNSNQYLRKVSNQDTFCSNFKESVVENVRSWSCKHISLIFLKCFNLD